MRINPKAEIIEMDYGKNPIDHMAAPILIKIKYRIPGYAFVGTGTIAFVPLLSKNIFSRGMSHLYLNTDLEERKYPFRDRCSRLVEINETITIPDGYTYLNEVDASESKGKAASYQGSVRQLGNSIATKQKIVLEKRIYEPEDWADVKTAVKSQKEMAEVPVVLVR